jgi:hypothetical protein
VISKGGWPDFTTPPGNGCLATYRSFTAARRQGDLQDEEFL